MANYDTLKNALIQVIKPNGNEEITGQVLQDTLLAVINALGVGFQFMGEADPDTAPGTPDARVFYFAQQAGTYSNFDGLVLDGSSVAFLLWDSSWSHVVVNIPTTPGLDARYLRIANLATATGQGTNTAMTQKATTDALNGKVDKVTGKGLSTNDYTDQDKTKLGALPTSEQLAHDFGLKADKDADAVEGNLAKFDGGGNPIDSGVAAADIPFLNRALGKYDGVGQTTLSQAKAGKYVDVNGAEISASGYGISSPIQLNFGDILLVPSASALPAAVSVVSRIVTRTYAKVINYAYTYRQDDPTLYDTATADYDQTLVYTAVYDTSGETPVLTGWTIGGQTIATLPATHEVTESYYEPLVKQAVSAMPSTGYYVYLCPQAMQVVISGYTATVSGGTCLTVGLGIFKNIVSNFLSMPGQNAVAQALCDLYAKWAGVAARLENLGNVKAGTIDCENIPKVCGTPMVIEGVGAPTVLPHFVGQRYHDTTANAKHLYEAFAVTGATSDWVLIK